MEFAIGSAKNNALDIKIFMKDVGVSGCVFFSSTYIFNRVASCVNPVNTMYAALPALLVVIASIVLYLFGPLLDYQSMSADKYKHVRCSGFGYVRVLE